jgi:Flp pilus assembly pilin Flp
MVNTRHVMPAAVRRYVCVLAQRLRRSRGVSAVEYGVLAALLMCLIIGSLASLGTTLFSGVYNSMLSLAAIT